MDREKLMARYGELQIQAEIIQGQIMEVKKQIAQLLNQQAQKTEEPKKEE